MDYATEICVGLIEASSHRNDELRRLSRWIQVIISGHPAMLKLLDGLYQRFDDTYLSREELWLAQLDLRHENLPSFAKGDQNIITARDI